MYLPPSGTDLIYLPSTETVLLALRLMGNLNTKKVLIQNSSYFFPFSGFSFFLFNLDTQQVNISLESSFSC